jgi:hypothetical protein
MKRDYAAYLKWVVIFSASLVGIYILYTYQMFTTIWNSDLTKLSFVIFTLYIWYTLWIGVHSCLLGIAHYRAAGAYGKYVDKSLEILRSGWFIANLMFTMGLLGTIIGFIYTMSVAFTGINAANPATIQHALTEISTGLGTALYTTATGIVCSSLLRLQLFVFENSETIKDYQV